MSDILTTLQNLNQRIFTRGFCPRCDCIQHSNGTVVDDGHTYHLCDECLRLGEVEYPALIMLDDIQAGRVWYRLSENNATFAQLQSEHPDFAAEIIAYEERAERAEVFLSADHTEATKMLRAIAADEEQRTIGQLCASINATLQRSVEQAKADKRAAHELVQNMEAAR